MIDPSKSKKCARILATARDLFWKHGFKRVSIEEICGHAGASKMTFYRFFPNKIELAKAVFDKEVAEGLQKFRNILTEGSGSAEKIRKILQLKLRGTHNISKEFLQDFYGDRELGLKAYVEDKTKQTWTEITKDFQAAQENGWFRGDLKPEFLFYVSQKMSELITDEKLLSLYPSPQALVMEFTNFVSYGISPRNPDEQSTTQQ